MREKKNEKSYCGEGKFKAILEARMEMNIKNIYKHIEDRLMKSCGVELFSAISYSYLRMSIFNKY